MPDTRSGALRYFREELKYRRRPEAIGVKL
jgi:hypothetical protein